MRNYLILLYYVMTMINKNISVVDVILAIHPSVLGCDEKHNGICMKSYCQECVLSMREGKRPIHQHINATFVD